jgi:hypothetical protein
MLVLLFSNTLESIVVLLFYTYIIGEKQFILQNKLKSFLYVITYIAFSLYTDMLVTSGIHTLLYIIFFIVVLGNITKTTFFQSFIAIVILHIVFILSEIITMALLIAITQRSAHDILDLFQFKLLGHITVRFIQFLLVFFLYMKNIKLFNKSLFKKKKNIISTGLLQIFIFSLFCLIFFWKGTYSEQQYVTYQILTLILILLTVILSVIDYKEREKAIKISYQKKLQEANVENMEKLVKILRKTHHDIGNHLNKIFAIAQTEQKDTLDRIKDYISTLTDNIKSSFKSYNTGNSYLDGLLAVKNNEAKEKGIQLEVDFDAKLDILPISDQALISIVSNIVDNAFDAMENQVCDQKFISISGYIESSKYILSICNNGSVIAEQSLSKIFELGYSTKGNVSAYNGYGLYIAKQYVEENNGEIFVSSSDSDDETEFLMKFFLLNDDS